MVGFEAIKNSEPQKLTEQSDEEVQEKKVDDFFELSHEERLNHLGFKEITDRQREHSKSLGISEEDYLRRSALINRLELDDFNPTQGPTLTDGFLEKISEEKEVRGAILEKIAQKGTKNNLREEERIELKQAVERAMAVDESIEKMAQNPEAQQEIYTLLRKREVETIDDAQLIEDVHDIVTRYEIMPPVEESHVDNQPEREEEAVREKATAEEIKNVRNTTGIEAKDILGKNRHGELLISTEGVLCGFNLSGLSLNWVKININGHEFKYQGNGKKVIGPGNFQREMGLTRSKAVFAYYELPFDTPEQEKLIELFLNETGDIQEFQFQDFTQEVMDRLNQFFRDLKPTASMGAEGTKQTWRAMGILNEDNEMDPVRYVEMVKQWEAWRKTRGNEPFLSSLNLKF